MKKTKRTPLMQTFISRYQEAAFGATKPGQCVTCKSEKTRREDFKDAFSRKEFGISGMCQKCQDSVFG